MSAHVHTAKRFVLGEFQTAEAMVEAARKLHAQKLGTLDAYSPYPVEGIDEALELPKSPIPKLALAAGLTGASAGYAMQWWMNSVDYAINVANRPPHSFWQNIPITFECGILATAITLFVGSIALFGLPRPYHGVFEAEAFRTASLDAFWISVETLSADATADIEARLREVGAGRVQTVVEAI